MPIFARLKQKLHLVDHDDDTDSKDGEGGEEIPGSPSAAKDSTLGGPIQRFRYKAGNLIGQGAFGEVFTIEKADGTVHACKRQSKKFIREHHTQTLIQNEVRVMQHLRDMINAVQLVEAIETRTDVYLVMELCAGGDVLQSISAQFERTGLFTERSAATMARHMLGCVLQLHDRNVIHRDLKPENFMFYKAPDGKVFLKVCDFGLAEILAGDETLTEPCGTPNYMAPEMWRKEPYTNKVDVWSMGCCLVVMITGVMAIEGKNMDQVADRACQPIDFEEEWPWGFLSADLKDLLQRMLEIDPAKRITVAEALAHPWVKEGGTAEDKNLDLSLKAGLRAYIKANAVQKAACQLLAQNCTAQELLEIKKRFQAVDTNNDGMISLEEIRRAVTEGINGWAYCTKEQGEFLFESFDADHNGYVDLEEYVAGVMHIRALHDDERIRAAFDRLDADGDGKVTKDEIVAALTHTHQSLYQVPAVMAQIDTDGDGVITFEEFSAFWKRVLDNHVSEVKQEGRK